MFLFSKSIIPEDSKILDRDLGHVLWKLTILSDLGENVHAALDWEVTLLAKNMSNAKLLTLLNKKKTYFLGLDCLVCNFHGFLPPEGD